MSYISLLIAWFKMLGAPEHLTSNQWWDQFLDHLVNIERWFLGASWVVVAIAVVVTIIVFVIDSEMSVGCGCAAIFLLFFPLWEWITLKLATVMATGFDPVNGIVNTGKFWSSVVIYILIGSG